tara:strand:- start:2009 stop:2137 length:129 start_codon:yes stop_codon:yes gene_type:complete
MVAGSVNTVLMHSSIGCLLFAQACEKGLLWTIVYAYSESVPT